MHSSKLIFLPNLRLFKATFRDVGDFCFIIESIFLDRSEFSSIKFSIIFSTVSALKILLQNWLISLNSDSPGSTEYFSMIFFGSFSSFERSFIKLEKLSDFIKFVAVPKKIASAAFILFPVNAR